MTIPEEKRAIEYVICSAEALNIAVHDGGVSEQDLEHFLCGLEEVEAVLNKVDPLLCIRHELGANCVAAVSSRRFYSRLDPTCLNMPIFRRDSV